MDFDMLKLAKFSFSHFSNFMCPRWNELRVFCCVFARVNTVIVKHLRHWRIFHVVAFCFDTVHNGIKIKTAFCSNCQNCVQWVNFITVADNGTDMLNLFSHFSPLLCLLRLVFVERNTPSCEGRCPHWAALGKNVCTRGRANLLFTRKIKQYSRK